MSDIRFGVIGLGSMGRRHFDTFARLNLGKLSAVATRSAERRSAVREEFGVEAVADYRQLDGMVDAVTVAVPTVLHAEVSNFFLERGVHVLIEKPIATTAQEARALIDTAKRSGALIMVGHIERFNPAYLRLREWLAARGGLQQLGGRINVEAFRMGPFDGRIQDVGVEHDLMIHDVDAISGLVPFASLELQAALGMQVITDHTDVAMARFVSANSSGDEPEVHVQILANRIADERRRGFRLTHKEMQVQLDFFKQTLQVADGSGVWESIAVQNAFPLDAELRHFIDCIKNDKRPDVCGEDGLKALEMCMAIHEEITR